MSSSRRSSTKPCPSRLTSLAPDEAGDQAEYDPADDAHVMTMAIPYLARRSGDDRVSSRCCSDMMSMPKTMQNIAAAVSAAPIIRFSPNKLTPASSSTMAAKIQKNRSIVATDNAPAEDCSYHFVERFTIARCSFRSRRTRRGRCPSSVKVLKDRSSISRSLASPTRVTFQPYPMKRVATSSL